ncbi:hypothetical protein [Rhizobium terrae]|nr:hypothetical protein [Rhizobium terrae]
MIFSHTVRDAGGQRDHREENFMIIAGLVASVCLGVASIAFFVWRDSKLG